MILHFGVPTRGDPEYYTRWEATGLKVYKPIDRFDFDDITVLVVDQYFNVTNFVVEQYKNLKYICSPNTAHTHLTFDDKKDITIISLKGEKIFLDSITSVAEFTIYLMLKLSREKSIPRRRMSGKKVGIIGYGRIGSKVANICKAMGMEVFAFGEGDTIDYLKHIARESDYFSIHLPEDPSTYHLIDEEIIKELKPTCFVINTARPSVIDEEALYKALKVKSIAGAALDVLNDRKAYFTTLNNVISTGHVAGRTIEDRIATDQFIIDKLRTQWTFKPANKH